jgi:hypothetical protein
MLTSMSGHALERAAQRNIQTSDIAFVMAYGQRFYTGEAIQYFLGRRDIPEQYHSDDCVMKLEGTTLITAHDGTLITLYKNKRGCKNLRRKCKWHRQYRQAA